MTRQRPAGPDDSIGGAQQERTRLAWVRTVLAMLAGTALLCRDPSPEFEGLSIAAALIALLLGVLALLLVGRRPTPGPYRVGDPRVMAMVTGMVVVVGLLGVTSRLLPLAAG